MPARAKTSSINLLFLCLEELRKLDPEMPIQRAATFCYVAAHEGCTIRSLSEALDVVLSTTNRNIRALGEQHRRGYSGHGLLITEPDPIDPRRKIIKLTDRGRQLARTITNIIGN